MPEFLNTALRPGATVPASEVVLRLFVALILGAIVAWIYRQARGVGGASSFPGTLILLCVLIAMVTQVIGNNVARAFSLVGALSIVRFRTVVRDTQDTAYVIFSVVVGMAVGSHDLWVAGVGLLVVGCAAWFLCRVPRDADFPGWLLNVRLNVGLNPATVLGPVIDRHTARRELLSAETVRQGIALEVIFDVGLQPTARPDALVQELNRIEGVQGVSLKRRTLDTD